jgi:glutathione S-transferase
MKLSFSPGSPFARKLRIAAIELGLIERIAFIPAKTVPGEPNDEYVRDVNVLKKLPALILDDGQVLVDSFVIAEYFDELAGGRLVPAAGPERWRARSDHSLLQGMLDSMLLCRYEKMVRPKELFWQAWYDDHWSRAWNGMARFDREEARLNGPLDIVQIGLVCVLGYADFRFSDCGWREAYPNLNDFNERMMQRESVKVSVPPPM